MNTISFGQVGHGRMSPLLQHLQAKQAASVEKTGSPDKTLQQLQAILLNEETLTSGIPNDSATDSFMMTGDSATDGLFQPEGDLNDWIQRSDNVKDRFSPKQD